MINQAPCCKGWAKPLALAFVSFAGCTCVPALGFEPQIFAVSDLQEEPVVKRLTPEAFADSSAGTDASAAPADSLASIVPANVPDPRDTVSEPVLELPETQVTAKKQPGRAPTQPEATLKGKALDRTRGSSLGDALEVLPGVTVMRTGSTMSKPAIRGMQGDRIVIMNNGVRQEGQQWGSEHAPEVDPYLASRLTVIKGASSVRYGANAMGGVVLVEPWPLPSTPFLGWEAHLAGFSNNRAGALSATVEGSPERLPGLGWRLQGTARKGGNAATPGYRLNNTAMEESNLSTSLGMSRPRAGVDVFYSRFDTKLGIFSGSHIGSLSDLDAALKRESPNIDAPFSYEIARPRQEVTHHLLKTRGFVKTGESSLLNLTYALQHNIRSEFDHRPLNDALAARNLPELKYEITTHTADLAWEFQPSPAFQSSLGGNGIAQFNLYEGRPFIPNFLNAGGGGFWTGHWSQGRWELEAGARYDYKFLRTYRRESGEVVSRAFEFSNPSGMLGGAYHPLTDLTLKAHASTAYRSPGVNELFSEGLHHGAAAIEFGDPELDPERSYDLTTGVDWAGQGRLRWEASFYYNYIRDYIYLAPTLPPTLTIRGAFPTFNYRQTDASFKGADFSLRLRLGYGLSYASKGSLLRAYNESAGEYLVLIPADRIVNGVEWDHPAWKGFRELHAALSIQSVFKQTHSAPDSLDYAPPPEGYTLVHARVGFVFPLKSTSLNVDMEVSNLLDTRYRDYSNRFRYFADDPGRNIAMRLKVPFEFQRSSGAK